MDVQRRATYRIETFGGLVVAGGDGPLTGAATQRKTLLLLAVLAAAGSQGMSREKLIGLFWPDSDDARARHALKQALHILRRDLRDPELVLGTPLLRLNPESITSDVQEFEDALSRGEPEQAVALYRGPFLDSLYLDGAPAFEHWVERERGRLAFAHSAALERLAVGAAAVGDHARAVGWWRQRAAADPLSSRISVELMKALVAAGDPEAALQHARVHEALVRQELDAPPDPTVAALVDDVRHKLRTPRATKLDAEAHAPFAVTRAKGAAELSGDATAVTPAADALALASSPDDEGESSAPERTIVAAPRDGSLTRDGSLMRDGSLTRSAGTTRGAGMARWWLGGALVAAAALVFALGRGGDDPIRPPAAPHPSRSVAVLPFVHLSGDSGNAYFSDGLGEELIAALSRIEGLRVAARTSSFALRDAKLNVRTIGDTLGVATVVEGSVRQDGDRLRVSAQLIDATSGYQLWSGEFDRRLQDVFAVQDELASAIASALQVTLGDSARGAAGATRTPNSEAYDLYLRGTYFRSLLTRDAIAKANEYYDRAIALDSGYALAYAGKASSMGPLLYYRQLPGDQVMPKMRAAARRALELDDRLGEAHVAMGMLHFFYEWDWPAALREFTRATELNPSDPHAFHMLANYLRATRQFDAAITSRRRALELDPLNARIAFALGRDYMAAGKYDSAEVAYRRGADIDPMNPIGLGLGPSSPAGAGEVLEWQGRPDSAVEEYLQVAALRGATTSEVSALRSAHAAGGMRAFWRRWLQFEEKAAKGAPRALLMADISAHLGDDAGAAEWLERAFAERDPGLVYLAVDPHLQSVRAHPRVVALLQRMKLER